MAGLAVALSPAAADGRDPYRAKAVTLGGGVAPDGSRYEWIGYERRFKGVATRPGGREKLRFDFRLCCTELVSRANSGQRIPGGCEDVAEKPPAAVGPGAFPFKGDRAAERPDVVISGTTGARVARLRIFYTDLAGERHELPVNHIRVDRSERVTRSGKRGRRTARRVSRFGLFAAFVPAGWAARDKLFERERELRGNDPSVPPDGRPLDLGSLMYRSMFAGCHGVPAGRSSS